MVAGVAIHPNDAARMGADLVDGLEVIEALAQHPRVRAVGETGLDHFRTTEAHGRGVQKEAFAAHIALAKTYDKTLVIHDRDAHADVLDVLDAEGLPDRIVMHCFSGDAAFAKECLNRGAHLSFAGTVTFKANDQLRQALGVTPLDRILVETDAPYLTPMPFPRAAQRLLPDPAHRPLHGRRARPRPRSRLPRAERQCRGRVRRRLVMEFDAVLRRRRMIRAYDPTRPVPEAAVDVVLAAAVRAPSAGFTQGTSFLVLSTPEDRAAYWAATADRESGWLRGMRAAPAADPVWASQEAYLDRYSEPDKGWTDRDLAHWPAPYRYVDAGMASMVALLTAVDQDLGACSFGVPTARIGGDG